MPRYLRVFSSFFTLLFLLNGNAFAEEVTALSRSEAVFENTNCAERGTCSLKKVRYVAEDYRVKIGGEYSYGTSFAAWYTTSTTEALREYVFVQFIKGCVYTTEKNRNGTVEMSYTIVREFFGGVTRFCHEDWEVDTTDKDPVYWGSSGSVRQYLYAWNLVSGSLGRNTTRVYGMNLPPTPELYVSDLPAQAFYSNGVARNVSLSFRMCMYKASEVPEAVSSPRDVNFAKPIHCFPWKSSFIYDHERGEYKISLNSER